MATKEPKYPYPSQFGSHASMVEEEFPQEDVRMVVCRDERGLYRTPKARLDNGVADPNRYAGKPFVPKN